MNKRDQEVEVLDLASEEQEVTQKEHKENIFVRLKNKFNALSLRTRVIIIVSAIILVLAIISLIFYFTIFSHKNENKQKKVIVAKENYRYEDGTLYFVVNNKDIGSYECKNKDKNLCYVAYTSSDDDFDTPKYEDEDEKIRSKIIDKNYVFVFDNAKKDDEKIILYDIKKKKNLDTYTYLKTYNSNEDLAFVKNEDDKYGVIDLSSKAPEELVEFKYDYLGIIEENSDSKIIASLDQANYLLDLEGKEVTKALTGKIKNYNSSYVKTTDANNKYTLYDYEGNKKTENANYIDLLDNYYFTVDEENKLRVFGYDDVKYTEDGITLYKTDYVQTLKDKQTKEAAKSAYTYTLDNNEIIFNVTTQDGGTETSSINLLEGLVSQKLKYLNYFNRTLYFYKDEEKKELINSYRCNNENIIDSADKTLDVCNIASDTLKSDNELSTIETLASITPVYNERFVFIKDKDIINLIDLKNEKVIGTYQNITTFSDSTQTENYLKEENNGYVIAQNKNGKYGMLKITSDNVSTLYPFEYDRLEKLNQYLMASSNNKYFLLDYNGNKVTTDFSGPIRNYNKEYVKVLDNKAYYIYDFKGNLIIEDGYKYVELYDDFVALVDDANHLSVTDYKGNMLIKEILKLSSYTYYHAKEGYVNAFSIKKEDNKLIITVATSQETKTENAKDYIYDLKTKERVN